MSTTEKKRRPWDRRRDWGFRRGVSWSKPGTRVGLELLLTPGMSFRASEGFGLDVLGALPGGRFTASDDQLDVEADDVVQLVGVGAVTRVDINVPETAATILLTRGQQTVGMYYCADDALRNAVYDSCDRIDA